MDSILFVGNSYTYYNNLPRLFSLLASDNRQTVRCDAVTQGARKLTQYRNAADAYTEKLVTLLSERRYRVAFLQEQSILPLTGEQTFARRLAALPFDGPLTFELKPREETNFDTYAREAYSRAERIRLLVENAALH